MMLQYACCLLLWPRFSPLSHTPSLSSSSIFVYLSFSCTPWCMCLSVLLPARSLFSLLPGLSLHRRSTAHLRRPSVSIFAFVPVICVFSSWPSKGVCAAGKGHVPTRTMIVLVYLDVQYIPMYVYTCGKRRCYCTSRILIPNPLFLLFRPPPQAKRYPATHLFAGGVYRIIRAEVRAAQHAVQIARRASSDWEN